MESFDVKLVLFLNQFSHCSWLFDRSVVFISGSHLLKGGILAALLWWAWFKYDGLDETPRERILTTILSCLVAIAVARILALSLPFRPRPLHNPEFAFQLPYGMTDTKLEGWSSFPSDHAAMFFALAAGLLLVSRSIGIVALAYIFSVICLPRVYLGKHYPTDIIAGALIGVGIVLLANRTKVTNYITKPAMRWLHIRPSSFYACFFLLTFQIAELFDSVRNVAEAIPKVIKLMPIF